MNSYSPTTRGTDKRKMTVKSECGVFCFHPRCLQGCGSIGIFVFFVSLATVASESLLAFMTSQVMSLERHFGFNSAQTGLLLSCNEIGFIVFTLLMGFLAPKVHIPKFLSFSTFVVGVAAFICALPYFVSNSSLDGESFRRLSKLPDVDLMRMMKNMPTNGNGPIIPPLFTDVDLPPVYLDETAPTTGQGNSSNNSTLPKTSANASSPAVGEGSVVPSAPKPPAKPNPFAPLMAKFRQMIGDDLYLAVTASVGIREGVTPTMTLLKRMVKVVAANSTIMDKLPPAERQKVMMFARISKRSVRTQEMGISDVGELSPFELMMIFAPQCTSGPKGSKDCGMAAKVLNKDITNGYTSLAFALFAVGMVLQGIAKSSKLPMALLYFDDNGLKAKTPMYLGILMMASFLGVIVATAVGVGVSRLHVSLEDVPIHPMNFHWIGAWWLGFIIITILAIVTAIPLMCFPKRLSTNVRYSEYPIATAYRSEKMRDSGVSTGYLSCLKRCLTNPVLMGLIFCGIAMTFWLSGAVPFAAKYLETQFTVPIFISIVLAAVSRVIPPLFGCLFMGLLLTKKSVSEFTMLKLALGCSIASLVLAAVGLGLGCPTVSVIGFNSEFTPEDSSLPNSTACASSCFCESADYFPLCGSNGRNYFSPCHAGCKNSQDMTFTECSCIGDGGTGTFGLCEEKCKMIGPYMLLICLIGFLVSAVGLIVIIVGLRSVADRDRSTAVALFVFLTSLLGFVPGPFASGKLVDSVCLARRKMCSELFNNACAVYDTENFRIVQHVYFMGLFTLTVLGLCFVIFKARNKKDWNSNPLFPRQRPEAIDTVDGVALMNRK